MVDREQPEERACRLQILVNVLEWSKHPASGLAVEDVLVMGSQALHLYHQLPYQREGAVPAMLLAKNTQCDFGFPGYIVNLFIS